MDFFAVEFGEQEIADITNVQGKAPQDVDVLPVLDLGSPCSRPLSRHIISFVHGLRGWWASFWVPESEMQSRSLRTEAKNLEIQDLEDVDFLRRPGSGFKLRNFLV